MLDSKKLMFTHAVMSMTPDVKTGVVLMWIYWQKHKIRMAKITGEKTPPEYHTDTLKRKFHEWEQQLDWLDQLEYAGHMEWVRTQKEYTDP